MLKLDEGFPIPKEKIFGAGGITEKLNFLVECQVMEQRGIVHGTRDSIARINFCGMPYFSCKFIHNK